MVVEHVVVVLLCNSGVQLWVAADHRLLLGASFGMPCFLFGIVSKFVLVAPHTIHQARPGCATVWYHDSLAPPPDSPRAATTASYRYRPDPDSSITGRVRCYPPEFCRRRRACSLDPHFSFGSCQYPDTPRKREIWFVIYYILSYQVL